MSKDKRRTGNKKRKLRSSLKLLALVLAIAYLVTVAFFAWSPPERKGPLTYTTSTSPGLEKPLKFEAAIIDQLVAFSPDVAFAEEAKRIFTSRGLTVKYHPAQEVTVDLYKKLPSLGYGLIVLRVHSAVSDDGGVYPFTSEPYSESAYPFEQLMGYVGKGSVTKDPPYYFAISPSFVTYEMEGNFRGAIIVLSTCYGLSSPKFADRLIQRGASVVIGWDGPVNLAHTDKAINSLLKVLTERSTVTQAIEAVMKEVGPDPEYGSLLKCYPTKGGMARIWNHCAIYVMQSPSKAYS